MNWFLKYDVRTLQNRPMILIAAQLPVFIPIGTLHGEYGAPMLAMSACAGFNPDAPQMSRAWMGQVTHTGSSLPVDSLASA